MHQFTNNAFNFVDKTAELGLNVTIWQSALRRFRQKVYQEGDGCWEWQGAIKNNGYGHMGIGGTAKNGGFTMTAHRLSWLIHQGRIPSGLCVLHACDNRKCVNPTHLFLGTRQDNYNDMRRKGRGGSGSAVGGSKLHERDIPDIRNALASGELQKHIAMRYGVTGGAIQAIASGRNWREV